MPRLVLVTRLSLADFLHERTLSACLILSLTAVMSPLLVLYALKFGIVTDMRDTLQHDPTTRELNPIGQGRYTQPWLDSLHRDPEITFLTPATRFLAATIRLTPNAAPAAEPVDADMIPTAEGDPLLGPGQPVLPANDSIIVSQSLAEKLGVTVGGTVIGRINRETNHLHQEIQLRLQVSGIVGADRFERDAAFVSQPFLLATEDYREGFNAPLFRITGQPRPGERTFASFRLFARDIDGVEHLRDRLATLHVETSTHLAQIRVIQKLDRGLTLLFAIIAALSALGFAVSLTITLWANVERKRRELSLLRLIGLNSFEIATLPMIQAMLTALGGSLIAFLVYTAASPVINLALRDRIAGANAVCRLHAVHFVIAASCALVLAMFAAAIAGVRATRVPPSEGLRYE